MLYNKGMNIDDNTINEKMTKKQKTKYAKKAVEKAKVGSFREFIEQQGVLSLAIGLVLGTAATTLVNSLMNNVIFPPLGFILGSADGVKGLALNLGVTPEGKEAVLYYGAFLNDLLNFLVVALVIYWVVKIVTNAMQKQEELAEKARLTAAAKAASALVKAERKKIEKRALKKEAKINKKDAKKEAVNSEVNVESLSIEDGRKK